MDRSWRNSIAAANRPGCWSLAVSQDDRLTPKRLASPHDEKHVDRHSRRNGVGDVSPRSGDRSAATAPGAEPIVQTVPARRTGNCRFRRSAGAFGLHELTLVQRLDSEVDGASKLLFQTAAGHRIETVILRIATGRVTVVHQQSGGLRGGL